MTRRKRGGIEPDCPVPNTHRRLASAHRLWHQALKEYADPEGFTTNLNATIQELRNITFILQKEKSRIPDFETWYAPHQERLKRDPLLRWLVETRNKVVKEGDLMTHSKARVSLIDAYQDRPSFCTEVPPSATTELIAVAFAEGAPPSIRDARLVVERRWEVDGLPGRELLDALAECYSVLATVVADAHRKMGTRYIAAECSSTKNDPPLPPAPVPPCMRVARELRTVHVDLDAKAFAVPRHLAVKKSPKHFRAAKERYGEVPKLEVPGYEAMARQMHEMARQIIQQDPDLVMAVQLLKDGRTVQLLFLRPTDKADKYVLWRDVASTVAAFEADAVIANAEAWLSPLDGSCPPRECVSTFYERSDGRGLQITSVFRRKAGKVVLDAPVEDSDASGMNVLEPVRAVWRRRAAR
jgi:hypothetical protein